MNDFVGKINLDELYTRKKEVHENKLKIYNMILKEFTTVSNILLD